MEIFFKSRDDLDKTAERVCEIFNLQFGLKRNCEKRYGENRGGEYYLFRTLGLELYLTKNSGDIVVPRLSAYQYSIVVQADFYVGEEFFNECNMQELENCGSRFFSFVAAFLCRIIKSNGIETIVD